MTVDRDGDDVFVTRLVILFDGRIRSRHPRRANARNRYSLELARKRRTVQSRDRCFPGGSDAVASRVPFPGAILFSARPQVPIVGPT